MEAVQQFPVMVAQLNQPTQLFVPMLLAVKPLVPLIQIVLLVTIARVAPVLPRKLMVNLVQPLINVAQEIVLMDTAVIPPVPELAKPVMFLEAKVHVQLLQMP